MAIAAGTPVTNKNASGGTSTFPYTVNGPNSYLVLYVYGPTSDLVTSVTWNTTNILTQKKADKPAGFGRWLYLYGLSVPAGTGNVIVTAVGSDLLICIAEEYMGVASATTAAETTGGSATTFSATRSMSAAGAWMVAITQDGANGDSVSAGANTTLRSNLPATDPGNALWDSGGTASGSYTLNFSKSGSGAVWMEYDIELAPDNSAAIAAGDLSLLGAG